MTRQAYIDAVARIERVNPAEPLLPTLQRGHSQVNVIYLQNALKRLPATTAPAAPAALATRDPEIVDADDVLKGLYKAQQILRGEKAKLSNSFHDCSTDADRRAISAAILEKEATLRTNEGKIAHYKANQVLPPEQVEDEFYLPDDTIQLVKAAASIASKISQTKKKLDELGALPERDPARADIAKYEAKLARLKLHKGYADQKIKGIQSGGL